MRKLIVILLCLLVHPDESAASPGVAAPQRNFQLINGRWFDGKKFAARTFYSVGGVLTSKKPARVDSVIDLKGGFVVPPYGEAHNHNVEGAEPEKVIRAYLEDGIFYVKNPNNLPRSRTALAGKVNTPTSVDVVFANGGLTSAGGHPAGLVRRNILRKVFTEADAKLAARKGTFVVTTLGGFRQLREESPARRAAQALFVKNLRLLSKRSVRIAIGSDSYRETSAPEARFLASLKVFDNLTLLKMWCETTPQTIFPGRKIGRFEDGYESSFLVLAGDPLKDFANTGKIEMRFKQGEMLTLR